MQKSALATSETAFQRLRLTDDGVTEKGGGSRYRTFIWVEFKGPEALSDRSITSE